MKQIVDMSRGERRWLTQKLIVPLIAEHGVIGLARIAGVTKEAVRGWRRGRAAHQTHLAELVALTEQLFPELSGIEDHPEVALQPTVSTAGANRQLEIEQGMYVRNINVCPTCGVMSAEIPPKSENTKVEP